MTNPSPSSPLNYLRMAILGAAIVFALFVAGIYLLASGDDATPPSNDDRTPFGGTPLPNLPGLPTPVPNTGPLEPNRPSVGEPAPDFALVDVRNPVLIRKLSDFAGTPVVLNWYASWCGPCRDELPAFEAARQALGSGVAFLGVNFLESRGDALSILEETGATFPAVMDPNGAVSDHYRVTGLPITMFLDAEGVVRAIHRGGVTVDDLTEQLATIGIDYIPDTR